MIRTIALVLWVGFLILGAWSLGKRAKNAEANAANAGLQGKVQKGPTLIARRDLPLNWRIAGDEFAIPSNGTANAAGNPAGKYLSHKVASGEAVPLSDLKSKPKVPLLPGKNLYRFPLRQSEMDSWNAGSHADLFLEGVAVVGNAEVGAVECDPDCEAVLQLSASEIELLRNAQRSKLKATLR